MAKCECHHEGRNCYEAPFIWSSCWPTLSAVASVSKTRVTTQNAEPGGSFRDDSSSPAHSAGKAGLPLRIAAIAFSFARVPSMVVFIVTVLPSIVALFVLVPLCEHRIGTWLTLEVFAIGDWTATTGTFLALRVLTALGDATARHALAVPNSGASAACYACAGAFVASLPRGRTRRIVAALLVTDLVVQAAVSHMLSDVQHPISAVVGIAVASLARDPRWRGLASTE